MKINEQKIINFLSKEIDKDFGYCDDCLSNELHIIPRQQVNQICRVLEDNRKISRIESTCRICKKFKISNFIYTDVNKKIDTLEKNDSSFIENQTNKISQHMPRDNWSYENEWFEETNISRKIRDYLFDTGYEIIRFNDDKKKKGPDIVVIKNGIKTIIEVKGFPSKFYVGTERKGKKKPTHPNLQAKHWFSEALLSLVLEKCKDWNNVRIAMGLPRFQKYDELCSRIAPLREAIGIKIYFVYESGKIEEI